MLSGASSDPQLLYGVPRFGMRGVAEANTTKRAGNKGAGAMTVSGVPDLQTLFRGTGKL